MSVEVLTFGCRLNAAESVRMREAAGAAGVRDAVIVNTCAVTAEAVRQARQAIRRAHRADPSRPILVSGCAAETEPETFRAMPEVARLVPNAAKLTRAVWASDGVGLAPDAVSEAAPPLAATDQVRSFLAVQTGCDHRCTFCVIPFGRGPSRSVPMGAVVEAARRLVAGGAAEIVLSGVDLTSWGDDLPGRPRLGRLVRTLLRHVPELPRLRLSSLDAAEADPDLLRALAEEERLQPHLHLSLQSGADLILKRMKRRHSRAVAVAFVEAVRRLRPDAVFGADLIAGFPTETEAHFADTLALLDDCAITYAHVFPFSARAGTPAARMPPVDPAVVRERARRLREAGAARRLHYFQSLVGQTVEALVESSKVARTRHFAPVAIVGGRRGRIVAVRIDGTDGDGLAGTIVGQEAEGREAA